MCVKGAYSGVLPVAYDLLQVGGWVEEEVLPPFVPLDCHSAVHVDAERERSEMRVKMERSKKKEKNTLEMCSLEG